MLLFTYILFDRVLEADACGMLPLCNLYESEVLVSGVTFVLIAITAFLNAPERSCMTFSMSRENVRYVQDQCSVRLDVGLQCVCMCRSKHKNMPVNQPHRKSPTTTSKKKHAWTDLTTHLGSKAITATDQRCGNKT